MSVLSHALFRNVARSRLLCQWTGVAAAAKRSIATHTLKLRDDRTLAYKEIPGQCEPTIVYVPGLHSYSNMNGMMSNCLLRYCDQNQLPCISYDHECMGSSEGDRSKVIFSHWVQDVQSVITELTVGPVIIVSLSMGGWLSLVAAEATPSIRDRLCGMVLYAPAINYVYPYYQFHRSQLGEETRKRLDEGDIHFYAHSYGDALLKKDFAEDSRQHELSLDKASLSIECPVRVIHGLLDKEVEPEQSLKLTHALLSSDVDLIYRKEGLHKAEEPPDIQLILNTLDRMVKDINA